MQNELQVLMTAVQQIGANVIAMQRRLDETSRTVEQLRAALLEATPPQHHPKSVLHSLRVSLPAILREVALLHAEVTALPARDLAAKAVRLPMPSR